MRDDSAFQNEVVVELWQLPVIENFLPDLRFDLRLDAAFEVGKLRRAAVEQDACLRFGRPPVIGELLEHAHADEWQDEGDRKIDRELRGERWRFPPVVNMPGYDNERERAVNIF